MIGKVKDYSKVLSSESQKAFSESSFSKFIDILPCTSS